MPLLQLAAGDVVALVCGEMKCPCAALEETLTDSTDGSAQSPSPRQLNWDLHIHPGPLLT